MKPEAQRIAIAEACGWTPSKVDHCWNNPSRMETREELPDYMNDLNAMNEAEKVLENYNSISGDSEYGRYITALQKVTAWYRVPCATAAQRAEAFLRTLGKWEDHP